VGSACPVVEGPVWQFGGVTMSGRGGFILAGRYGGVTMSVHGGARLSGRYGGHVGSLCQVEVGVGW
jgi:hypothetical protein